MALTNATAIAADGTAIQIDSSNNVGIGVSPSYKLHVSGAIYATADVTAFSSAAAKDDIVTIADPLDLVGKLRGVSWTWKDSGEKSQGVIYEELRRRAAGTDKRRRWCQRCEIPEPRWAADREREGPQV